MSRSPSSGPPPAKKARSAATTASLVFPKRAAVQRMEDNGTWTDVPMLDEFGNEQHVWPDHHSATYALVRHVHRQFDLVLRGKLRIEDVPPPDRYRVIEIEEH